MKIGAYVHMYPPVHNAGAEHYLHGLFKRLVQLGHECKVYVGYYKGEDYEIDGVTVSNNKDIVKDQEIIFTHLDLSTEAQDLPQPIVHLLHNDLAPYILKRADLIVANTDWIATKCSNYCQHRYGCETIVVHPPLDLERVSFKEREPRYLTLINATPAKGSEIFYQLVSRMTNHQFLLVKGAYGPQVAWDQFPNLKIIENTPEMGKVYAKTKCILMPSQYESYGMVAAEAMANGIPVVANMTVGLLEAVGGYAFFPGEYNHREWFSLLDGKDFGKHVWELPHVPQVRFNVDKEIKQLEGRLLCLLGTKQH